LGFVPHCACSPCNSFFTSVYPFPVLSALPWYTSAGKGYIEEKPGRCCCWLWRWWHVPWWQRVRGRTVAGLVSALVLVSWAWEGWGARLAHAMARCRVGVRRCRRCLGWLSCHEGRTWLCKPHGVVSPCVSYNCWPQTALLAVTSKPNGALHEAFKGGMRLAQPLTRHRQGDSTPQLKLCYCHCMYVKL
jgi:hypothetical protein